MIEELWYLLLARIGYFLQIVNNVHRHWFWWLITHWKTAIFAILLGVLTFYGGKRLYGRIERARLLSNADAALQKGEPRDAAVFAITLLRSDPHNIRALKIMTQAADKAWPRDALHWHERLDKLQPGDAENCLAWALTAFHLNMISLAREVLNKIPPADTNTGEYQWLAGKIAESTGDLEDAASHLEKAVDLSPDRKDYAFDLAKVRLQLPGKPHDLAREALEGAASDPERRLTALRLLLHDAEKSREPARARSYFQQMQTDPGLTSWDRIGFLDFLRRSGVPGLMPEITGYEKTIQTPAEAASLAFWMSASNMPLVASEWIESLPAKIRSDNRVQLALAEAYAAIHDWPRLRALTTSGDWKDLDFLRAALLAQALAAQGESDQAQDQWNLATLKAEDNPQALVRLCAISLNWDWRWETQAMALAWRVVNLPKPPSLILDTLQERFATQGDTQQLYRLLARRRELEPANPDISNNFALVSLLLKKNQKEARELAAQLYKQKPADAQFGSTYAFSLYLDGDNAQALEVMSRFGEQLRIPTVALYYGIFLAAGGEPSQARVYLQLARRAQLLPEEQQLRAQAEVSIGDKPFAPPEDEGSAPPKPGAHADNTRSNSVSLQIP